MRIVIIENNKKRINKFIDWAIHIIGYTLVLISVSVLFKSFYIDNSYFGLYSLLATIIIYILKS